MRSKTQLTMLLLTALLAGCATSQYQASSEFSGHAGELKKIGIVTDIRIYAAGGLAAEKSAQSAKDFEAASLQNLADKGYAVTVLPLDDDLRTVLTQYQAVRNNIAKPFSASGGKVAGLAPIPGAAALAAKTNVDGIVILNGMDSVVNSTAFTAGLVGSILMGAAGAGPQEPIGYADIAILDKTGKITFYDGRNGTQVNLTNADGVADVVSAFANDLVVARQPAKAQ